MVFGLSGNASLSMFEIKRRFRVLRTAENDVVVRLYEVGTCGVKGGMQRADVERLLGPPMNVWELGPFGSSDYVYPLLRMRFLDYGVADVKQVFTPEGAG